MLPRWSVGTLSSKTHGMCFYLPGSTLKLAIVLTSSTYSSFPRSFCQNNLRWEHICCCCFVVVTHFCFFSLLTQTLKEISVRSLDNHGDNGINFKSMHDKVLDDILFCKNSLQKSLNRWLWPSKGTTLILRDILISRVTTSQ